jgi:hypothetical protein
MPAMKSLTSETLKLFMPWSEQVKQTCGYSPDSKKDIQLKVEELRN